jgi:hypothetical protein
MPGQPRSCDAAADLWQERAQRARLFHDEGAADSEDPVKGLLRAADIRCVTAFILLACLMVLPWLMPSGRSERSREASPAVSPWTPAPTPRRHTTVIDPDDWLRELSIPSRGSAPGSSHL